MVATVTVVEITGSGPTYTTITDRVRLFTADQPTTQGSPQTSYPVPIPPSSFNYSYWKAICLNLAGSDFTITNIRHYSDGAIGWNFGASGALLRGARDAGDQGCPDGSYVQASGTQGTTGYYIGDGSNGHTYYKSQSTPTVNINGDTSGSPATIDSTTHTVAERTKHVVLQVKVGSDATQGTQTAETLTWKYDES